MKKIVEKFKKFMAYLDEVDLDFWYKYLRK
jgi:hypothetical protein